MKSTIAAIATAPGEGAIGIVRLSGPGAFTVVSRIFRSRKGRPPEPWHLTLGRVRDPLQSEDIDEVLAVLMTGPRTYTGEDMVEFQAHGGRVILEGILRAVLATGARIAAPGEFTKRAFLSGRLDLAQAEAVIDLIRARSDRARREALRQLDGRLSQTFSRLKEDLTNLSARIEAELDFSEEGGLEGEAPADAIERAAGTIGQLLSTVGEGKVVREGIQVTFAGRQNVGKSSIVNMLTENERSIVTPLPGTTRDTVESPFIVEGTALLIIDTAGLGPSADAVEEEGIRRSRKSLQGADLAVIVIDSSIPLDEIDRETLRAMAPQPSLIVFNKTDLPEVADRREVMDLAGERSLVQTSALTGAGRDDLYTAIGAAARKLLEDTAREDPLVTSSRHADALGRALAALRSAGRENKGGGTLDLVAAEVREALSALGEITGETATEEILDRIFSQFCIGK